MSKFLKLKKATESIILGFLILIMTNNKSRDKIIQRYETRDLLERDIVYLVNDSRNFAIGEFIEDMNVVFLNK